MKRKITTKLLTVYLALVLTFLCSCSDKPVVNSSSVPTDNPIVSSTNAPTDSPTNATVLASGLDDEISVTVLDVGQGDSIFVELPDEECMLIDSGESEYGNSVTNYIRTSGYDKIDYLIATHPHADHIGGMREVVSSFDIGKVYMPRATANTKTYENLLNAIDQKGLTINTAKAGVNILSEDNLDIDIIAPNSSGYEDINNYSAVVKITYGDVKFLFMGDAETESENEITADVSADFIKIGHHGSSSSSSENFVRRVGAKYAAVSVAEENDYNHPVEEIINRWRDSGAQVLMTKDVGNIVAQSDGKNLTVNGNAAKVSDNSSAASQEQESRYILNINTKKIHTLDCPLAEDILSKNKDYTTLAVSQLESQGYTPCKSCKPQD